METVDIVTLCSRRRALALGAGLAAATCLTACGGDDSEADPQAGATPEDETPSASESPMGDGSGMLVKPEDVPVGGAVSVEGADGTKLIVSQPTEGEFIAFAAACTHNGCPVEPQGDKLVCPCHGSTFDLATGENTGGPAPSPLIEVAVSMHDGMIMEG